MYLVYNISILGKVLNEIKMKVVDPNVSSVLSEKSPNGSAQYFLVSKKWSAINDQFITFVRKSSIGYCYNLNWAGACSSYELEPLVKTDKTILIHITTIEPYLTKVSIDNKNYLFLPNTEQVRKIIGFQDISLMSVI